MEPVDQIRMSAKESSYSLSDLAAQGMALKYQDKGIPWYEFHEPSNVKETQKDKDRKWYSVTLENHTGFGIESKYGYVPKVGDTIALIGEMGRPIRGMIVNDKLLYYKSDEQMEQEHKEWVENYDREKVEKFEKNKDWLDIDYETLPQVFKNRIDRYRRNNPKFRVDFESYEMRCCIDAVKLANYIKDPERVMNCDDEPNLFEKAGLDGGHSGNSFGCTKVLAYWYLKDETMVEKVRGALTPLVGSKEYGDY